MISRCGAGPLFTVLVWWLVVVCASFISCSPLLPSSPSSHTLQNENGDGGENYLGAEDATQEEDGHGMQHLIDRYYDVPANLAALTPDIQVDEDMMFDESAMPPQIRPREIRSKEASMFTRLGRAAGKQQAFMRLGRAPSLYTRMGRAPSLYTRMGRAQQMFTRIGRSPKGGYMRLGRAKPQAFMRIGRAAQLFTRMGRLNADQQTRIGRAANMFTRMGRSAMKMDHLKRADFIFTRLGKRSMQEGKPVTEQDMEEFQYLPISLISETSDTRPSEDYLDNVDTNHINLSS